MQIRLSCGCQGVSRRQLPPQLRYCRGESVARLFKINSNRHGHAGIEENEIISRIMFHF